MDMMTLGAAMAYAKKAEEAAKPTAEELQTAVDDWLDDHPEATTTVEDGSITKAKLDSNLQGTVDDVDELNLAKQNRPVNTFTGSSVTVSIDDNSDIDEIEIDLPLVQSGSGYPSMTNYRPILAYDDTILETNGTDNEIEFARTICCGKVKSLTGKTISEYCYFAFDGTENWQASTGNTHYVLFSQPSASSMGGNNNQKCSHFLCGYADVLNLMATPSGTIDLQFPTTNNTFPELADWKTYLAQQYANGTPVAICYKLATIAEAESTAVSLTLESGDNTFASADGTLTVTIYGDIVADLDTKLDKQQGAQNAGKALVIGDDGEVEPSAVPYGADPGIEVRYNTTHAEVNAYCAQRVSVELESSGGSVDVWQYESNMLPLLSSGAIGNVAVTIEPDGTIVFSGTTSSAGAVTASMNIPFILNGNNPFDKYIFSYEMNKAAPNTSGHILVRVFNQSSQNFISIGMSSSTSLSGSIANAYGDSTTSLLSFQIYFYNIPNGVVFDNWRLKCKLEHHPVATAYSKPSLLHKTVTMTDGAGSTEIDIANGVNHVITNADDMHLSVREQLPTPSYCGKRWGCFGDSITQKDDTAYQSGAIRYYDIVAPELGLSVVNYGRATTGYTTTGNVVNGKYYERMQVVNPDEFDFMTIMGSTNDVGGISSGTIEIGTKTDTGTTTVCGCINTTIDNYYAKAPLKPLGIISMLPTYAYGPNLIDLASAENYVNALKEICANRGIPFLDLYHGSGMRPWDATVKSALFWDGDGIHPNNEGVKWFAPMIREFIKALV